MLVHQGGYQSTPGVGDINGCDGNLKNADGTNSDIAAIVKRLDNAVDLVISGHTHAAYNCSANTVDVRNVDGVAVSTPRPTGLPNRAGRLVPVTSASAFGRLVTDIDLTLDPGTRDVIAVSPANRLVDRTDPALGQIIAADPAVRNIVQGYNRLVLPLADAVVGTIASALPITANDSGEEPAGSLIADAQLRATQPAALGGAQIAFFNKGGARAPGFQSATSAYPYDLTYGDAFTVQPFGNSLVTMTLTSLQIKNLLEQQFKGCLGQTAEQVMQVSNGFKYTWRNSAAPCAKILDVTFTPTDLSVAPPVVTGAPQVIVRAGVVQNPTKSYRVTVNNFMATGGGGLTTLTGGTNILGGPQDIDALTAYLGAYKSPRPAYDAALPALAMPRITRLP